MSIDKSLRRKNSLARSRNVLTRAERIKVLVDEERWKEGRSPFNLPKVRVLKVVIKKGKKAKDEEGAEAAPGAAAAPAGKGAPAAKGAAAAKAPAGKAPAGKAPAAGGDKKPAGDKKK